MSSPAGVDNALKMREMFLQSGYRCRLDIGDSFWPVARLVVKDGLYECTYYFQEDGTYYRGSN